MPYCSAFIIEVTKSGAMVSYDAVYDRTESDKEIFVAPYSDQYGTHAYCSRYISNGSYISAYVFYTSSDWSLYAPDNWTSNPVFPLSETLKEGSHNGPGPSTVSAVSYIASNMAIKATSGGTVTGTTIAAYEKYGTSHSPSAGAASAGYRWDGWYSSDTKDADEASCTTLVSTEASIAFTTGLQDKTYFAKYTDLRHTLTVTPPISSEGSVTVYVGDSVETLEEVTPDESGNVTVVEDQYVRVVATPTSTYKFYQWAADGVTSSLDVSYTFEMPAWDATLTADFEVKDKYTVAWRVGDGSFPYDPEPNPATVAGCSLAFDGYADTDPPIETSPDKWYEGGHSLTATAGTGWEIIAWIIINADTGVEVARTDTKPLASAFGFSLAFNTIIQCDFYKIPITASAAVHTASNKAGVYAEVSFGDEQGTEIDVHYGDTVTYTATVGTYAFGGWYNAAGDLLSSDLEYEPTLTADTTVYLKVKGTVTLTATAAPGASGTVSIDGGTARASATKDIILGETCTILATPASLSSFECWFNSSDTYESPITGYDAEQLITVGDHTALSSYCVLTSSLVPRYLAVLVYDNATGEADGSLGAVSAVLGSFGTELTKSEWETATGCTSPVGTDASANHKYYSFLGTRSTSISAIAADSDTAPFLWWYRNKMTGTAPNLVISTYSEPLGSTNPLTSVSVASYVVKAYFGVPTEVTVTCGYCTGSDASLGGVAMTPVTAGRSASGSTLIDIYAQGTEVTFAADVANGSMFSGWYSDIGGAIGALVSPESSYTAAISLPLTLFAKFEPDDHAIFAWEGGTANKEMTWRSKRYMSSKPFALSSARVYADRYPVTMNVYVSSSPNAPSATVPSATLTIADQDPRRLATIKREKYVELQVVATGDVTELAAAGSMEGLIP